MIYKDLATLWHFFFSHSLPIFSRPICSKISCSCLPSCSYSRLAFVVLPLPKTLALMSNNSIFQALIYRGSSLYFWANSTMVNFSLIASTAVLRQAQHITSALNSLINFLCSRFILLCNLGFILAFFKSNFSRLHQSS
jgi:hypothetical protein